MRKLFLIPARGGSKGLPKKNILPLLGRPMIHYTLDAAKEAMDDGDEMCVSTDDLEIVQKVYEWGMDVPFIRPRELSSDTSTTQDVIIHALEWYKERNKHFDLVILLQATSPLRTSKYIKKSLEVWHSEADIDLVLSVKDSESNPYYLCFEEDENGYLYKTISAKLTRRQDSPRVYDANGAIYVMKPEHLQREQLMQGKIKKMLMPRSASIDVDDSFDLLMAETIMLKSSGRG